MYSRTRLCNCSPVCVLKGDRGRILARVAGAGFFDPLEFAEGAQLPGCKCSICAAYMG
jgi:hypothetical protein